MHHQPNRPRPSGSMVSRCTTALAVTLLAGTLTVAPASGTPTDSPSHVGVPQADPMGSPSDDSSSTSEPTPEPDPTPEPEPVPPAFTPMKVGERSHHVRVLESRLHQLGLHSEIITSRFDQKTRRAVVAFKRAHQLAGRPGVVNRATWNKLISLTRTPTQDELKNIYTPGPAILKRGMKSPRVRDLEARLTQLKHFSGRVGPRYDRRTQRAVRKFQRAVKIPVTGAVDARTLDRLRSATRKPSRAVLRNWGYNLDPRCRTGRVMCIDKTTRSLKWVVGGKVKMKLAARFGDPYYPTRQGTFRVFLKSRDHVSSIYHSPMPFAMFFSGGQAVHYSSDFKRTGYNGHSHGCVNIRNRKAIATLFDWVSIGDRVVVYRS